MTEKITHIDGDILVYQYGSLNDEQGRPLTWNLIVNHLNAKVGEIARETGADDYLLYITGSNNFRKDVATIQPYKGNRKEKDKPHSYERVKDYLLSGKVHPVVTCEDYEADDGMSMAQCKSHKETGSWEYSTIASNDKDLKMVPGYHYGWKVADRIKEVPRHFVEEIEGLRWFYQQLLMGDGTDNIKGIHGLGKVAAKNAMKSLETEEDMYTAAYVRYEQVFGSYWRMFMHENAQLLWMVREELEGDYGKEISERLDKLHESYLKEINADLEEF